MIYGTQTLQKMQGRLKTGQIRNQPEIFLFSDGKVSDWLPAYGGKNFSKTLRHETLRFSQAFGSLDDLFSGLHARL